MRARIEVVVTSRGGLAVLDRAAGEVMHPGVGARIEAEELYVRQSRLADRLPEIDGIHDRAQRGGDPVLPRNRLDLRMLDSTRRPARVQILEHLPELLASPCRTDAGRKVGHVTVRREPRKAPPGQVPRVRDDADPEFMGVNCKR